QRLLRSRCPEGTRGGPADRCSRSYEPSSWTSGPSVTRMRGDQEGSFGLGWVDPHFHGTRRLRRKDKGAWESHAPRSREATPQRLPLAPCTQCFLARVRWMVQRRRVLQDDTR